MTKPKVYISRICAEEGMRIVRDFADMRVWEEDRPVPREVLLQEAKDCDGLLVMLTDKVDAALLDACPNLKIVSNHAVGYDNIDVKACIGRGVLVGNTPGVLTETTADLTFALILASARRLSESIDFVREGQWKHWSPLDLLGYDIHHATLGIIGMGRIGREVAKRARGFDMPILYHNRTRDEEAEKMLGVQYVGKEELLQQSDFVSLHIPLSPETRHYISTAELNLMKSTALLINTARGGVVDQKALYHALRNNQIAAAGLDVTDPEPILPDDLILKLPNVTIIPHIGSASRATRGKMAEIAAKNLVAALKGEPMISCVNTPSN
jgi:glyoxylate reductase